MNDEVLTRCRERAALGLPLYQPDAAALIEALAGAESEVAYLRAQLDDAWTIAQEIYEGNDRQGMSFETYQRLQRGELPRLEKRL